MEIIDLRFVPKATPSYSCDFSYLGVGYCNKGYYDGHGDGTIVAIGAFNPDDNGTNAGHIRVYKNLNGTWTKVGQDIDGESSYDYVGSRMSLSSDGSTVVVGVIYHDGNANNSGNVRIYKNINNV